MTNLIDIKRQVKEYLFFLKFSFRQSVFYFVFIESIIFYNSVDIKTEKLIKL